MAKETVSDVGEGVYSFVKNVDLVCFNLINHTLHSTFLNGFMPFLSNAGHGGVIWICISMIMFTTGKPATKRIACLMLLALVLSYLASEVFKLFFQRYRPFETLTEVDLLVKPLNDYSFPSGHAACAFASALVLMRKIPRLAWFFAVLAVLMAFSRVYVGVHYPSDVLVGSILGLVCGTLVLRYENLIFQKIKNLRH